jgi:hypothetical protein
LFTNLASDTPARIRLIAKFIEADYEKVDRLLEMREVAETKLRVVNREIAAERRVSSPPSRPNCTSDSQLILRAGHGSEPRGSIR